MNINNLKDKYNQLEQMQKETRKKSKSLTKLANQLLSDIQILSMEDK